MLDLERAESGPDDQDRGVLFGSGKRRAAAPGREQLNPASRAGRRSSPGEPVRYDHNVGYLDQRRPRLDCHRHSLSRLVV